MQTNAVELSNEHLSGKIMLRNGNENQEPMVVFVKGVNQLGSFVCEKINTGEVVFSKESDLIDFDYQKFQKLFYRWQIDNSEKRKRNYIHLLSDIVGVE